MQHNVIKIENYLLIVDDSEIKEGDYTFQEASNLISKYNNAYSKKIIAHLPLNNSPILEGVDLLPPLEDEVEKLADEIVGDSIYYEEDRVNLSDGMDLFMLGYNKTKEKYKYTEEDILDAWELGASEGLPLTREKKNNLIKHLQQPKYPVAFECEIEDVKMLKKRAGGITYFGKPKTITNSQGLTQWVGEYIY
jgi:hypothetical protein